MPKKKVYVRCWEPIAVSDTYQQAWSDVYLRFHIGRKPVRKAPTLISKADLLATIRFEKSFAEEYPQYADETLAKVDELESIAAILSVGRRAVCVDIDEACPDVYTDADYIDRHEAETMIECLLLAYGIKDAVQKWKRPGLIATPVGCPA